MCKVYDDVFSRERKSNQQQVQKNKRKKRILLVDDEYDANFTIKLVLEKNGFRVDSFTDASGALENFRAGAIDVTPMKEYPEVIGSDEALSMTQMKRKVVFFAEVS
jgi:CheY-like chemotaxis protein